MNGSGVREQEFSSNYPPICRACFGSRNIIFFEKQHYIWNVFQDITNIQPLHTDSLPGYICHECIQKLKDIAVYVDLCRTNDMALRQYLSRKQPIQMTVIPQPEMEIKSEIDNLNNFDLEESHQKESSTIDSNFVKDEVIGEDLNLYLDEESCQVSDETKDTFLAMKPNDCSETGWNHLINDSQSQSFEEEAPLLDLMKIEKVCPKNKGGSRSWHCEYCSKSFNLKHHLIGHLKTHSGIKPYYCTLCLRPFADRSSMNRHHKTHTGLKPFMCKVCGHSFAEKYYLAIHQRSHSGEKPYTCEMCTKRFSRKDTLNMHLKTHTGERPYSCTVCQKTFSFKHHLIIHTRNHNGEKPFHCVTCSKSFTDRSSFNRHIKSYCRMNGNTVNVEKLESLKKFEQNSYDHIKND